MLIAFIFASTLVVPGAAIAQPAAAPLDQFLESRVPDELAVEGIILGQRELVIKVEQIGDKLLISLIATPTGRVVASSKVDDPPTDREASLAIVTQVTATLYTQYTMLPSAPPGAQLDQPPAVAPIQRSLPRTGLTLEFGMGFARPGAATGSSPELGLGFGVGAWIFPGRMALLGRFALATVDGGQVAKSASYVANTFIGANLQYWVDDHVWVAAGPGFAAFSVAQAYDSIFPTKSACAPDCLGVGLDLRAGYSLGAGSHQLDLSVEAISGYYANDPSRGLHMNLENSNGSQPGYATTLIALIGYRFL